MGRSRSILNAVLVLLLLIYMYPGGLVLQNVDISFLGVPFFVWWIVVLGPVCILSVYYINARIRLSSEGGSGGV